MEYAQVVDCPEDKRPWAFVSRSQSQSFVNPPSHKAAVRMSALLLVRNTIDSYSATSDKSQLCA